MYIELPHFIDRAPIGAAKNRSSRIPAAGQTPMDPFCQKIESGVNFDQPAFGREHLLKQETVLIRLLQISSISVAFPIPRRSCWWIILDSSSRTEGPLFLHPVLTTEGDPRARQARRPTPSLNHDKVLSSLPNSTPAHRLQHRRRRHSFQDHIPFPNHHGFAPDDCS